MATTSRDDIIEYYINRGANPTQINNQLSKRGIRNLTYYEQQRIKKGKQYNDYNPVTNIFEDLQGIGRGLSTFFGGLNKYVTDPSYREQINPELARGFNQGPIPIVQGLGEAIGETYNLNDGGPKNPLDFIARASAGIYNNPVTAGLDLAPATRAIPRGSIGSTLSKLPVPQTVKNFVPSREVNLVNDAIKTGRGRVGTTANELKSLLDDIGDINSPDFKQAVRNVTTGDWRGNPSVIQQSQKLAKLSDRYNQELVALGVDVNQGKNTAIAQSIFENIDPQRTKGINLTDVNNAIETRSPQALAKIGINEAQLNQYLARGEQLYLQGRLRPVTHRGTFATDNSGIVTQADKQLGTIAERRLGIATPEEVAPTLRTAYGKFQQEITKANRDRIALDEVVKSVGRKIEPGEVPKLGKNEVLVSPEQFNDIARAEFQAGRTNSIPQAFSQFRQGIDTPSDIQKYANSIFAVDKTLLDPLSNSINYKSDLGTVGNLFNRWKPLALSTPKYVVENRLDNTYRNILEGVTVNDYFSGVHLRTPTNQTIFKGRYADLIPDRLKTETSFQGVLGPEAVGTRSTQAFQNTIRDAKRLWQEGEYADSILTANKIVANPVLALESGLELQDRSANFIRQARRLADQTGESVESILKRSNTDNKLYNQINTQIERSLGDYTGRNWAINPKLYDALSFSFPFFKYPTQSIRSQAYFARNKPLEYQAFVQSPARIGQQIYDEQVKQYGLEGYDNPLGGIVTAQGTGRNAPTIVEQFTANPFQAGTSLLANAIGNQRELNINPIYSVANVAKFQDRYGNSATSGRYLNANGKQYVLDSNGNPTRQIQDRPRPSDYLQRGLSEVANTYASPAILYNRVLGPTIAGATNQRFYNNYSTSIFGQVGEESRLPSWLVGGNTRSRGKETPREILGPWIGQNTRVIYPEQLQGRPTDLRRLRKREIYSRALQQLGR